MSPFPAATPAQGGCGCLSIRARHAITCVVRARHWRHGARNAANAKAAVDPSVPGHSRHILSTLREVSDAVAHQSRQAAFGRSTTGNHSPIAVVDDACRNPIACWMHSANTLLNLTMRDTARTPPPAYHLPPAMSMGDETMARVTSAHALVSS